MNYGTSDKQKNSGIGDVSFVSKSVPCPEERPSVLIVTGDTHYDKRNVPYTNKNTAPYR